MVNKIIEYEILDTSRIKNLEGVKKDLSVLANNGWVAICSFGKKNDYILFKRVIVYEEEQSNGQESEDEEYEEDENYEDEEEETRPRKSIVKEKFKSPAKPSIKKILSKHRMIPKRRSVPTFSYD